MKWSNDPARMLSFYKILENGWSVRWTEKSALRIIVVVQEKISQHIERIIELLEALQPETEEQ